MLVNEIYELIDSVDLPEEGTAAFIRRRDGTILAYFFEKDENVPPSGAFKVKIDEDGKECFEGYHPLTFGQKKQKAPQAAELVSA